MKSSANTPSNMRVVVVNLIRDDEQGRNARLATQAQRSKVLHIGLSGSRYDIIASLSADSSLAERLAQLRPDLVIIDSDLDTGDVLEQILVAAREERCAVVLFTDDGTISSIDAAMEAGISAYIVAGLQAERIKPVLDVALARFQREKKVLAELTDTRQKLAERKVIERAKGVLMARHPLSEEQAYQKLRSMAMNKNLKLAEIAQRLLDVKDLLD